MGLLYQCPHSWAVFTSLAIDTLLLVEEAGLRLRCLALEVQIVRGWIDGRNDPCIALLFLDNLDLPLIDLPDVLLLLFHGGELNLAVAVGVLQIVEIYLGCLL